MTGSWLKLWGWLRTGWWTLPNSTRIRWVNKTRLESTFDLHNNQFKYIQSIIIKNTLPITKFSHEYVKQSKICTWLFYVSSIPWTGIIREIWINLNTSFTHWPTKASLLLWFLTNIEIEFISLFDQLIRRYVPFVDVAREKNQSINRISILDRLLFPFHTLLEAILIICMLIAILLVCHFVCPLSHLSAINSFSFLNQWENISN